MANERRSAARGAIRVARWVVSLAVLCVSSAAGGRPDSPFAGFNLPDAWEAQFWADPSVKALLQLDCEALAALVPVQAGLRFCRCPGCSASETDDPLTWSLEKPEVVTCKRCGLSVPNDEIPAKVDKKVPEETVEVLPGTIHRYPYHAVEAERQVYLDERLYLSAKRDYEVRQFLAKAALYASVRYHEQPASSKDPALARLACVLLVRFAQVYPAYAVHYDQPGHPKFFQRADPPPPYRRGYGTAKWDWSGCLNVPMNLVVAYSLLREDPALVEAGRTLGDAHPAQTIERALLRASAEFVRRQPDEFQESSLYAYRGMLAVGRLLGDEALLAEAVARLDRFTEQSFYHDGLWRQGDLASHRRVLALLDGWVDRMLAGHVEPLGMLTLARAAGGAVLADPRVPEIQQAAWPAPVASRVARRPVLLGGAGLARLAVGQGTDALDVELKGLGDFGAAHFNRLALRVSVGGQPVLGDLDDLPPSDGGWERSTASHNTVVIDGLNQRETPFRASQPVPGADIRFFAADPAFQVAAFQDRYAYQQSATRYSHTVVAVAGARTRYAVSVFEVHGGLQHDQIFHAPAGTSARWGASVPLEAGPASLLPSTIAFVPEARAEEGRWFVQAYGAFGHLLQGRADHPAQAWLLGPLAPGIRLHILGETPLSIISGTTPDPLTSEHRAAGDDRGRGALVLRRRSSDGSTLKSTFVTVFEPVGPIPVLKRVRRIASDVDVVVLNLETSEGNEHLIVNLQPGTDRQVALADGGRLTTDGLAVRSVSDHLFLAGGTYAKLGVQQVRQSRAAGTIRRVVRQPSATGHGWFEADGPVAEPETLAGRALLIRHGDGSTRGWTLVRADNSADGRARLFVREEPGFRLERGNGEARYYQFPVNSAPAPHSFVVSKIVSR